MTIADRPVVGVGVVILDAQDNLLLIERGREPQKGMWAVPGGKVGLGERMVEAAQREAFEETGLIVEVDSVIWVGEIITAEHHLVIVDFSARVVGGTLKAGDDAAQVRWVTLEEARALPLTPTMIEMLDTLRS